MGRGRGRKVQGIRSVIGRHKIDRRRLRIVYDMEKPKKHGLYMYYPWA